MKMSMGMNTNVHYKGRVYHIQTEDGGENSPTITTFLFKNGGVVASVQRKDYVDLLQSDSCRERVRALMKEQHKMMIRTLVKGEIEGLETIDLELSLVKGSSQEPFAKGVSKSKASDNLALSGKEKDLDTLIIEYLAKKDRDVT